MSPLGLACDRSGKASLLPFNARQKIWPLARVAPGQPQGPGSENRSLNSTCLNSSESDPSNSDPASSATRPSGVRSLQTHNWPYVHPFGRRGTHEVRGSACRPDASHSRSPLRSIAASAKHPAPLLSLRRACTRACETSGQSAGRCQSSRMSSGTLDSDAGAPPSPRSWRHISCRSRR